MSDIELNFINKSNDQNNSEIVIFQQNVAEDFCEIAVAWKVIKNCGRGDNHPFTYPMSFEVSASDAYGNFTPRLSASYGQQWDMVLSPSGDVLQRSSTPTVNSNQVVIKNALSTGAINGNIYKNGKLLATKTNISPQQQAAFQFMPIIYIGAVSQIEEGDIMNSAIINQVNTDLSLLGIASADIVMTGDNDSGFAFNLENIVRT